MKKTKTGISAKLERKYMSLAIFSGVGLEASTLAEKNIKKHRKFRNHLNLFESKYIFSLDLIFIPQFFSYSKLNYYIHLLSTH